MMKARKANRKQSKNEIETSSSLGKTQMGQTQKNRTNLVFMIIFSGSMHDNDDLYDKSGDQNKYDKTTKMRYGAKN